MADRQLHNAELQRLARIGAAARLEQIERERVTILMAFPGLQQASVQPGQIAETSTTTRRGGAPRTRGRKQMSAAAKRAVSVRMKRYWAERRKQKQSSHK